MPQQIDVEKDPFLVLLTDALRAGPGSPEWREAVAKLKAGGTEADEYRLLIEAREALESGREYRSVRAGPGFTRKLLNNLDSEPETARRAFPLTGFIAGMAVLVIAAIAGVVIHELYRSGEVNPAPRGNVDELANRYLSNTLLATDFDNAIPPAWRTIGSLPVEADNGLKPAGAGVLPDSGYAGGGVVMSQPIAADQTFSVTVTLQIHTAGQGIIPQVFVANSSDFSSDRATAAQELVWELEGTEQKVVADGRVERQAKLPARSQTLVIRMVLNKDLAIVDSGDDHHLWAGPNALGDGARYVGVRFIRTAGKPDADIRIQSVRVQKN